MRIESLGDNQDLQSGPASGRGALPEIQIHTPSHKSRGIQEILLDYLGISLEHRFDACELIANWL